MRKGQLVYGRAIAGAPFFLLKSSLRHLSGLIGVYVCLFVSVCECVENHLQLTDCDPDPVCRNTRAEKGRGLRDRVFENALIILSHCSTHYVGSLRE